MPKRSVLMGFPPSKFGPSGAEKWDGAPTFSAFWRLASWTDPDSSLMWTKKDNASDVNWEEASDYCKNLALAGYSDWRLPSIDELQEVYDQKIKVNNYHVKGNLQLSDWEPEGNEGTARLIRVARKPDFSDSEWSSTPGRNSGEAWNFSFRLGRRNSEQANYSSNRRAQR